jgi:3'(2'), 5'-bisphosphate nucleotidase
MKAIDLASELSVAMDAVRKAAAVCAGLQARLASSDKMDKEDQSPVTVADFASQAVICASLSEGSAVKRIMAEESSRELSRPSHSPLRNRVLEHVRRGLARPVSLSDLLDWIDRGTWRPQGVSEPYWTLDPVDGTKGFLRGGQYAVALALIDAGAVVLGLLACPNLKIWDDSPGVLVAARQRHGSYAYALRDDRPGRLLRVSGNNVPEARWCESMEPGHCDQSLSLEVASRLRLRLPPLRLDSQVKYAALAAGQTDIYLRVPTKKDYREKVWDHAAGSLIVEEAGGVVTDLSGKSLNFSSGEILQGNFGIIAASANIHAKVLEAAQAVYTT